LRLAGVRQGLVWQARQVRVWSGLVRSGLVWQAGLGLLWIGKVSYGFARRGTEKLKEEL